MKRAFVSIFLFVYFTVSTGFTVNMRYCMDRLQSWELGTTEQDSCDKCGMLTGDSGDCCRDEVKVIKLQQDLFPSAGISMPVDLDCPGLSSGIWSDSLPLHNYPGRGQHYAHSPPLFSKQDIYLFIGVFRI